jgi:hypothetical protein
MWIKSLNAASSYSHSESARVTLELTRQDMHYLTNALYRYITGGQNQNKDVCHLYSDLLIADQLMETGVVDDWTIDRVQDYRAGQYIPSDDDEEDVSE